MNDVSLLSETLLSGSDGGCDGDDGSWVGNIEEGDDGAVDVFAGVGTTTVTFSSFGSSVVGDVDRIGIGGGIVVLIETKREMVCVCKVKVWCGVMV